MERRSMTGVRQRSVNNNHTILQNAMTSLFCVSLSKRFLMSSLSLLIFAMTSTIVTSRATGLSGSAPPLRWLRPCSPGSRGVVLTTGGDSGEEASTMSTTVGGEGNAVPTAATLDVAATFHSLREKTMKLKKRVRELKNLYVQQRFRDESIVEDLEQMGLRLEGMPIVRTATVDAIYNVDMVEIVHRAFEYLARVAVFLDQARLGERLAVNERTSFEHHFERIENHNEDGLYWIMCSVHRVIYHVGQHPKPEAIQGIMAMKVAEVDRNAMRHTRDYIVLKDFERILERLSIDFAAVNSAASMSSQT